MTLVTIAVNGVPIEDYGLEVFDLDEWFTPAQVRHGGTNLVGRVGEIASSRGARYESRSIQIGYRTTGSTFPATLAQADAWHLASRGLLEIEFVDKPGRVVYGLYETAAGSLPGLTFIEPRYDIVGTIVCRNPLFYDRLPRIVGPAIASERLAVPTGTASGLWRAVVTGAATQPTLTARTRSGASYGTLRMTRTASGTLSLLSTDYLTFEEGSSITKSTSGVITDAYDYLHLDDTFFGFDPADGPTLETNQGTLLMHTTRAYLS